MPVKYVKGDLFHHKAKGTAILLHACNCKGSWGAGVAAGFRQKFPSTYEVHKQYCQQFESKSEVLLGQCQLIKSSNTDPGTKDIGECFVGCLFTSDNFGTKKLPPDDILRYTEIALNNLVRQLKGLDVEHESGRPIISLPKINAGLFGVPWHQTEKILETIDLNFIVYYL